MTMIRKSLVLVALLASSLGALAAPASGSLTSWLGDITPGLMDMVERHPRFQGQSVGVVALESGEPVPVTDEVTGMIRDHFIGALLAVPGVRVPVRDHATADILLGITKGERGGRSRYDVAFLDPLEGVWIARTQRSWEGRRPNTTVTASQLVSLLSTGGDEMCEKPGCIEVSYELFAPAWVFEFYTSDSRIIPLACERQRRRAGETRYGLNVPRRSDPDRPALGFYVLATEDGTVARELSHLFSGTGRCDGRNLPGWQDELVKVVERGDVSWRAIHFQRHGREARVL